LSPGSLILRGGTKGGNRKTPFQGLFLLEKGTAKFKTPKEGGEDVSNLSPRGRGERGIISYFAKGLGIIFLGKKREAPPKKRGGRVGVIAGQRQREPLNLSLGKKRGRSRVPMDKENGKKPKQRIKKQRQT